MVRSLEEIIARCKIILNDSDVINLVEKSSSPTAAYEMIEAENGDQAKAKADRWLVIIRRDYPNDYKKLISQVTLQQHDKTEREEKNEKSLHQRSARFRERLRRCFARLGKW